MSAFTKVPSPENDKDNNKDNNKEEEKAKEEADNNKEMLLLVKVMTSFNMVSHLDILWTVRCLSAKAKRFALSC